jgi:hypothetical protein
VNYDDLTEFTGQEALLLARALMRLADSICRTYEADIAQALSREEGRPQTLQDAGLPLDDTDLPF